MSTFHPFVSRALRTFRESFPLISLRLEEVISNELVERERNGRIDVAFTRTPVAHPDGLVVSSLLEEPLLLALPSDHRLAGTSRNGGAALSLKRLAQKTFIVYGPPGLRAGVRPVRPLALFPAAAARLCKSGLGRLCAAARHRR